MINQATMLIPFIDYMFHADCCCGCCCATPGWPMPPPIAADNEGKAGICGRPALAAVEPTDGAIRGETVVPLSLGSLSLRFFSRLVSHLWTDSSLRSTPAKDWSLSASGRH
jgi:hypothetical protein